MNAQRHRCHVKNCWYSVPHLR